MGGGKENGALTPVSSLLRERGEKGTHQWFPRKGRPRSPLVAQLRRRKGKEATYSDQREEKQNKLQEWEKNKY